MRKKRRPSAGSRCRRSNAIAQISAAIDGPAIMAMYIAWSTSGELLKIKPAKQTVQLRPKASVRNVFARLLRKSPHKVFVLSAPMAELSSKGDGLRSKLFQMTSLAKRCADHGEYPSDRARSGIRLCGQQSAWRSATGKYDCSRLKQDKVVLFIDGDLPERVARATCCLLHRFE